MIRAYIYFIFILLLVSSAWAEEKPKQTCQEQLSEVTMQTYNLDMARDQLERAYAQKQVEAYNLKNQVAQLQQQLDEIKKAQQKPKE